MGSFEVVAHRMDYWKKEGLKYTMSHFKQGKLMRNAIIQNNLDTGTTGFSPFTTADFQGGEGNGHRGDGEHLRHGRHYRTREIEGQEPEGPQGFGVRQQEGHEHGTSRFSSTSFPRMA